jgi:hypothetical protein
MAADFSFTLIYFGVADKLEPLIRPVDRRRAARLTSRDDRDVEFSPIRTRLRCELE